ncbi:molybdopterin-synthase adenylyltransferase MoeB [Neptuniibacter sp. CAU 1671]|uniref:molybdopterin-synthase adenylyltransferase MoeB n=1 Tax=Neptuniibacter sp. CAU 1671 TaxID=3032593 RepID=UPI0023DCE021|nr:molybdopterin-synthase adenylyltransferase MoeB [Neptuniibacter sp. CAU 1671]MDF2181329.1 molybdopterin-synthase adenylyltransferase MoeB [Neptuniibacter sp. CAU 1671]
MLSDEQLLRYSRQIMLPEVDINGQETWLNSTVLIVGLGGLGSPVAMYLAAAGIGQLVLVDGDEVDLSNLQRQIAHTTKRIGEPKVDSARKALSALNPEVRIKTLYETLDEQALFRLVATVDLVVDCSDNFATRFALNRACFAHKKPLVSGAAIRLEGQVAVYDPLQVDSPCYRCLYTEGDEESLTCSESGVLSPLVGIIGSVQALEALKVLASVGRTLAGRLLLLDASTMEWRDMKLRKDPACPVCSGHQDQHS